MKSRANLAFVLLFLLPLAGNGAPEDAQKPPAEPQITVQGAKDEAQTKARLRADQMMARCQYKPVMTDEEIAQCKDAQRASMEAARSSKK